MDGSEKLVLLLLRTRCVHVDCNVGLVHFPSSQDKSIARVDAVQLRLCPRVNVEGSNSSGHCVNTMYMIVIALHLACKVLYLH